MLTTEAPVPRGVPLRRPPEVRLNPVGSAPFETDQVKGDTPPVEVSVMRTGLPWVSDSDVGAVITNFSAGTTSRVSVRLAV